ncbi:hypothetical protein [Legionella cincinnatiensis]|uniref:Uncharacterized protein n=2 Tax=Legionella cincinnatiensis TaxID=28085 RepID=A0A378IM55_9GAMM|nr:hypothetical protein [Legionella cincinnatiensis]KTC83947.1 hypothetical protein Lcin_2027 [Legionella cincinnatiensis]STX36239.1 Uncharacterised protein [Legionella cincinnatiensis]
MKDKTEINDRTEHYLVKLRETIHNSQEKIKLERNEQQLESVIAMIRDVEQIQDTAIQKQLITTAHILAKNFQLDLIDLMIKNFSERPKSEAGGIKDKKLDENPLLSKFFGNVEDSINAFSKTMDYFSKQLSEDALFVKRLAEAKNWLEKSEPNQEIELADFNDLINTYAIILEKKTGNFSDVKVIDSSRDNNINPSTERIKTPTELTSELAQLSEQYGLQVSAIMALRQEFDEKITLVKDELDIKALLNSYNSLFQQVDEVIREREYEFIAQEAHSREQILKQITITKNAQVALNQINEKLIEFLVGTLNPAITLAEKNRVDYASCSVSSINMQLNKLKNLLQKCDEDPRLKDYLRNYENDITTALTNSHSIIVELSTKKLTKEQIEIKSYEAVNNLTKLTQSLDFQIKRINSFLNNKNKLEIELNELENERKEFPLAEIYRNNFDDLNQIRKDLREKKDIYSGIPKNISEDIVAIKNHYNHLKKEYTVRSNSDEVMQLNNLLIAIDALKTPDWVKNLKSELEEIRAKFLASKMNGEQFKIDSAKAIVTNVTEKEIRQLTNNHENATRFGNFFRALAEFIVAIGYSITRQEKPLYRPQFFASNQEKEIARKLHETYELLNIKEDAENQLSSQSQRIGF